MKSPLAVAIRSIREGLRLTQAGFARRMFVGQTSVSKWESGVVTPGAAVLIQLLRLAQREEETKPLVTALAAMGVPLSDLASLSEPAAVA